MEHSVPENTRKKTERKLLLFDVDGTLILTGGAAAGLMAESVSRAMHRPIQWTISDFVGNTDRSIIASLLRRNGTSESALPELTEEALQLYLKGLAHELKPDGVIRVLPGVQALMKFLQRDQRFYLGLLTGNVREGARIKLSRDGLFDYFPVGAFGDDALNREQLPAFAIQRAEKYYQCFFDRKDIWIIGDSINDIKCAQANHLKSLAVATGHIPRTELEKYHPTALLPDLRDADRITRLLLK